MLKLIKNITQCICEGDCRIIKFDKDNGEVFYRCDNCEKEYKICLEDALATEVEDSLYFNLNEKGEISFKIDGLFWCDGIIGMDEDENNFWLNNAYRNSIHDTSNTIRGA